jgi:NAD(P)H-hydrate epimerase
MSIVTNISEIRNADKRAIAGDMKISARLMMRAGVKAAKLIKWDIENTLSLKHPKIAILTGKGNNGGDGFVIADYLSNHYQIKLFNTSAIDKINKPGKKFLNKIKNDKNIKIYEKHKLKDDDLLDCNIIIDCLLGSGANGYLKEPINSYCKLANESGLPIFSIDLPTGLNPDTGEAVDNAIKAYKTISIEFFKKGFFNGQAFKHIGYLNLCKIGISAEFIMERENFDATSVYDIKPMIKVNDKSEDKYKRGVVQIFGGSSTYLGAPILTAHAASVSGAGLVKLHHPTPLPSIEMPSVIYNCTNSKTGTLDDTTIPQLKNIRETDIIVVGPGITTDHTCLPLLTELLKLKNSLIIDADAINLIAKNPSIYKRTAPTIFTPHKIEFERLTTAFKIDQTLKKEKQAKLLSKKLNATVIVKGYHSQIITDEKITINTTGDNALAKAGSGDVLTGILATSLINNTPHDAACSATFIHGLTAEVYNYHKRSFTPEKIINNIPKSLKYIEEYP